MVGAGRLSLESVLERVAAAAERAGRDPTAVKLVSVTKGHPLEDLEHLRGAGCVAWGENRAQELVAKAAAAGPGIEWHFIGHLQTNKVRLVRPVAGLLHSLDRLELAAAWLKGPGLPPPVLVQVNLTGDPGRQGFDPAEAVRVADEVGSLGLDVRGLMGMAPQADDPEQSREPFRMLAALGAELRDVLPTAGELSMGMTDDFEVAVEEGATLIRVGRAIFA
jgi:pyridoxal phosphate enzyme (YggS family)